MGIGNENYQRSDSNSPVDSSLPLLGGELLTRNALWNLAGFLLPLVVAIAAIPWLINSLGTERFGILTLAWVVLGYFGLFDLGLGRALTQMVSVRLSKGEGAEIPGMVWTASLLMLLLGVIGGATLVLTANWLVYDVLNVPEVLRPETLFAIQIIAIGVPVVISAAGLRGVLEAYQRFDLVNIVRVFNGVFTFLGPLVAAVFSSDLGAMVLVLLVVRIIAWLVYFGFCLHVVPGFRKGVRLQPASVPTLLRFGGWMTVTNIVGPLMDYMDRFLVAGLIGMAAVAYYATPYEIVTKLLFVAGAIVGVLFPAFAASYARESQVIEKLFVKGIKYIFILLFPAVLVIVVLAGEGLQWWLGGEFSRQGTAVLQWLAIGVLVNSLAQVPYALLQGAGRPDLTAVLHLVELPLYLLCAWWAIGQYGIEGAALAWTGRVILDAMLLIVLSKRFLPQTQLVNTQSVTTLFLAALAIAVAFVPLATATKLAVLAVLLLLFFVSVWTWFLDSGERRQLGAYLGSGRPAA